MRPIRAKAPNWQRKSKLLAVLRVRRIGNTVRPKLSGRRVLLGGFRQPHAGQYKVQRSIKLPPSVTKQNTLRFIKVGTERPRAVLSALRRSVAASS